MNNKLITGLIVGIAISLILLISIQLHWVSNAISIKKEDFNRSVHLALLNVNDILEKEEALKKIKSHQQGRFLFTSEEGKTDVDELIGDSAYQYLVIKELEKKDEGIEVRIVEEQDGKRTVTDLITIGQHQPEAGSQLGPLDYTVKQSQDNGYYSSKLDVELDTAVRNKLLNKTVLVSDIVRSLIEIDLGESIENRIDVTHLEDLLKAELDKEGINTRFLFGVFDQTGNYRLGNITTNNYSWKREYAVELFPKDLIQHHHTLKITFPKQINYIFSSISMLLIASLCIIIIISLAFFYSIKTILTQKKHSEIKNDFINNMTHELKTPISTISLACEALNDPDIAATPKLMNRYVGVINTENKRLYNQVENILKSAIWGSKAFKLNLEEVDVEQVVQNAIAKFEMQLTERGGMVSFTNEAKTSVFNADSGHLSNALHNLIDNAIKYSNQEPVIRIKAHNEKDFYVLSVCDNGIGISKENQKKIFDKLFRVPTGNRHDVKGFGLGLNYVKTIVERHGGSISVSSRLNKGSTFTIKLPMRNIIS